MSQYTKISQEDLTKFLQSYNLGVLREVVEETRDVSSNGYIIYTSEGRYNLLTFDEIGQFDAIEYLLELTDHLASHAFPCRKPIRRTDDGLYGRLTCQYAAITNYPEGSPVAAVTSEHCVKLGEVLAQLHATSASFSRTRRSPYRPLVWGQAAESVLCNALAPNKETARIISEELNYLRPRWPRDLPTSVIHGQLTPRNILFNDGNNVAVIGFNNACNDMWMLDLAIVLNAWCFESSGAFNVVKSCKLMQAYRDARKIISKDEIEAFPVLARGAALDSVLRTLLSRPAANDSSPSAVSQCMDVLRFHQMVVGAESYGLV